MGFLFAKGWVNLIMGIHIKAPKIPIIAIILTSVKISHANGYELISKLI
jgi:hypothetical protein